MYDSADNKARYAAYTKLQATATGAPSPTSAPPSPHHSAPPPRPQPTSGWVARAAYGEKLPIPEIVAIGGQSDGKSSLLEAFLGFRFNVREVEMGTRRPLMLQMVHNPDATEPRVCLQDEDADSYGPTIMPETGEFALPLLLQDTACYGHGGARPCLVIRSSRAAVFDGFTTASGSAHSA
jgi:hypothetical protein